MLLLKKKTFKHSGKHEKLKYNEERRSKKLTKKGKKDNVSKN